MAHSSAKSHLFKSLSHSRTSSPNVDEYATADSFDIGNDQILNSTVNMGGNSQQNHQFPLNYDEHPSFIAGSEHGSEGSGEMSIEMGRGMKRDLRDQDADLSSNLVFNFGGDSQYEVTGTPPMRPRNISRKSDGTLRKEAAVRNATEAAKSNDVFKRRSSAVKQRSLSEALGKKAVESDMSLAADDFAQATTTFNARNTRFTRSRHVSANEPSVLPSRFTAPQAQDGTPRRQRVNNPTVQSATYTANSFALPDLPNITELVSGVRKDGTPVFSRMSNKPRSRFTFAGNYKPQHIPIESVPIPDEEKAIYAALQLLKDKVAALEMEKSEAEKRTEEYESEMIDLRSQLAAERRRPDSGLGSDDGDAAADKWRMEKTRLQASLKATQDRLDRMERKVSVSEIAVKRVAKERDELVTQIGVAYFSNEELKTENETFRESYAELQSESERLKNDVEILRQDNADLRDLLAQAQAKQVAETLQSQQRMRDPRIRSEQRKEATREKVETTYESRQHQARSPERRESTIRSKKEARSGSGAESSRRRRSSVHVEETQEDIASKIAQEVQKHRAEAIAAKALEREATRQRPDVSRSRSKSRHQQAASGVERRGSTSKRTVSAPAEIELSDEESTGRELTQKTRDTLRSLHLPSPVKVQPREEDSRDLTLLSYQDPSEVGKLRRRIEEEMRARRQKRNASAPAPQQQREETIRSNCAGMLRKSSLKDMTAGFDAGTGRFSFGGDGAEEAAKVAKTVRVQSPHTSDASLLPQQQSEDVGDTSILSNTSRRRRHARAVSETDAGMTSAFILPDITLHGDQLLPSTSLNNGRSCIAHKSSTCTACNPSSNTVSIPTPIPVTDRETPEDPDVTSATIRPAQPPPLALATVIKNLEDEVKHLKLQLEAQQTRYKMHDPALSKRQRIITKEKIERLTAEIEKRSNQIYALYDVLEGQKEAAVLAAKHGEQPEDELGEQEVEETLMSIGIDPAELSGRVGRGLAQGLDGAADLDAVSDAESAELPWEGLSDYESGEEEQQQFGKEREGGKRRSAVF